MLFLDVDQPAGRLVRVRLLDGFDNPLSGRNVALEVVQEAPPVTDAGPPVDSGAQDTGYVLDTGAPDTGLALDSGAAVDAGLGDSGASDAAAGDGGANKLLSRTLDASPVRLALSDGGCAAPGDDELPSLALAAATDDDGYASFCVQPGTLRAGWSIRINPGGFFTASDGTEHMTLQGRTRAGTPTGLVLVAPAEPGEGEPEPRVTCRAGDFTAVVRFRVVNANGGGVPGVRVLFDTEGGLEGVSPRLRTSDGLGEVSVQAVCPARLLGGGRIVARLAEYEVPPKKLAVEVSAGVVQRVQLMPHGQWPDPVRSGAELSFRVTAFDAEDNKVVRAGLPPSDDQPDTRPPLQFRFTMASVGHAEALRLAGSNEPLISEVVTIDPELEAADLTVRVVSRATYSNPIQLRAQPVGSEVSDQVSINVAPGDPAHLVVSPTGVVEALLGGAAGELTYTVLDGVDDAANAVPNVPVQITAPQSLVLAANWTNAQTLTGTTGPDGRFRVSVLRANEVGDALVTGTLQTEGGPVTATTTVQVGEGSAASLTMTLDGQALPVEEGLPTLTMRAGTALTQSLAIWVLNTQGAGLANRGLSVDLEAGESCAQFAEAGVTDESGTITFGQGNLALTAGGNVATCVYRLAHGATPANARLRIVQIPGPPVIATLTAAEVRSLANNAQSPNEWTDDTSVLVTLQARDANNLAPEGLRMWLNVSNCFVQTRAFEIDENGEASFRVAGGNQEEQDCSLRPRYFNEVDNYITRAANGRPAADGETAEQVAAREQLLLETRGFEAPELQNVAFGDDASFVMTQGGEHTWQLTAQGLRFPNLLNSGDCEPAELCTAAELVAMERTEGGAIQVRLVNGEPQVLRAGIPLHYTFRDGGEFDVQVTIRDRWLGAGRWLGIRLKHPGDDGAVSNAKLFYAHPPIQWTGAGEGGSGAELTITRPDGAEGEVTIRGGLRANLDDDEAEELLVCGTDDSGGWFAVVHLDADGALPSDSQQAIRSWEGGGYVPPIDNRFACAIADMDNDGADDLVVLAAKQAGYPSLVLHRGTGDALVFRAQAERLVWNDRSLRNTNLYSMQLEVAPAAVVVCLNNSLNCQNRKRLLIEINEEIAEANGLELLDSEAVLEQGVFRLENGDSVHPDGSLSNRQMLSILDGQIRSIAFSPDGRFLAFAGGTRVEVWDPVTRTFLRSLNHSDIATSVTFSPTDGTLAVGVEDGRIRFWDPSSGQERRVIQNHGAVYTIAYSPDGRTLVSGDIGNSIDLWDVTSGAHLRSAAHHNDNVYSVAFSPDGQTIASGAGDSIDIVSATTFERLESVNVLNIGWTNGVAFSPDGQTLASIHGQRWEVRLWDLNNLPQYTELNGHTRRATAIAFSPDGRILASASHGGTVKIWEVASKTLLMTLHVPNRLNLKSLAFSYDGLTLAAGDDNHKLYLWSATPDGFVGLDFVGIGQPFSGHFSREINYIAAYEGNEVRLKRPYTWRPKCGDGVVDEGELYDDGQPWQGSEYAASCGAVCGDGVVQNGEDCDDGNDRNDDACTAECRVARCGDQLVRQDLQVGDPRYESCDDGNLVWDDGCDTDCTRCGDGHVGRFESCDDGNEIDGDGCSGCAFDTCGNGNIDDGEACDDGNQVNRDGCTNACISLPDGSAPNLAVSSCSLVLDSAVNPANGNYWLDPDGQGGHDPVEVYCDMTIDQGGWTEVFRAETNNYGGINVPRYPAELMPVLRGASRVMIAFVNQQNELDHPTRFDLIEAWRQQEPWNYRGRVPMNHRRDVWVDDREYRNRLVVNSWENWIGQDCADLTFSNLGPGYGKVCVAGTPAPFWSGFARHNVSPDGCNYSNQGVGNGASRRCSNPIQFVMFVR